MIFKNGLTLTLLMTLLMLVFQNCSPMDGFQVPGEPGLEKAASGNGDPYTGINEKSGIYASYSKGYSCSGFGNEDIHGLVSTIKIDVDNRQVEVTDECTGEVLDVPLLLIRNFVLLKDTVSYAGRIYERKALLDEVDPVIPLNPIEYAPIACTTAFKLGETRVNIRLGNHKLNGFGAAIYQGANDQTPIRTRMDISRDSDRLIFQSSDRSVHLNISSQLKFGEQNVYHSDLQILDSESNQLHSTPVICLVQEEVE